MTDLEKLRALLTEWKVEFEQAAGGQGTEIVVERGYTGFVMSFQFKPDGSFKDMGAYE